MKKLAVFLFLALLIGLTPLAGAADKTTITVCSWWTSESGGALDAFKKAFEAANPDISINFIMIPASDFYTKLLSMIAGGESPDVGMLAMDRIAQYASKNALTSLDSYMEKTYPLDDLWESLKPGLQYKGRYYAIPRDCTCQVLYYNKKLFDEAKVKYPDESWTWEDFQEAAEKLTKRDQSGTTLQYGYAFRTYSDGWYSWILSAGGRMVNKDYTKSTMSDPNTVKAVQFLADLALKSHVSLTMDNATAKSMGEPADLFRTNRLAMMIGGVSTSYKFADSKTLSWDIAPMPLVKKGAPHNNRLWTNTWILPKGAKHPEAAWRFLRFAGGPEGQKISADKHLGIPALKSIANSPVFLDGVPDHKKYFLDAYDYGEAFPTFPELQEFLAIFDRELGSAWTGRRTAAEACAAVDKEANSMLFGF